MKLLKEIIAQWGLVDAEQCKELALHFPDAPLIIKWSKGRTQEATASEVATWKSRGQQGNPHRLGVFLAKYNLVRLHEVLGV